MAVTAQFGDLAWTGLDAYHAPQNAPEGTAVQADNLFVQADRWFLRPGLQGQFAAALGSPIYALTPIDQSDEVNVHVWFACGGNLYSFVPDGAHTAPSQIMLSAATGLTSAVALAALGNAYTVHVGSGSGLPTGARITVTDGANSLTGTITAGGGTAALTVVSLTQSGLSGTIGASGSSVTITLDAPNVKICQAGGYVYVADGTTTPMLRFGADGSIGLDGASYTGLQQPSPPSSVVLSQFNLVGTPASNSWSSDDAASVSNLLGVLTGTIKINSGLHANNVGGISASTYWVHGSAGAYDAQPGFSFPMWPPSGAGVVTTTLTAGIAVTGVGSTYTVAVASTTGFSVAYNLYAEDGSGNYIVGLITAITSTTMTVISTLESGSNVSVSGSTVGLIVLRLHGVGGSYVQTRAPIALPANGLGLYPEVFQVVFTGQVQDTGAQSSSGIQATLFAYDGSGNQIGEQILLMGLMTYGVFKDYRATFDFRGSGVQKISLRLEYAAGGGTDSNPHINNIRIYPGGWGFGLVADTPAEKVLSGTVYASPPGDVWTGGSIQTGVQAAQATMLYTRGRNFLAALSSPNWSQKQRVVFNVTLAAASSGAVPVRLFVQDGSTSADRAYSAETILSASGSTVVSFDLTVVDPTILAGVTAIGLEFSDDILLSSYWGDYRANPASSPTVLSITSIEDPGNLTVDTTVDYKFVEFDARTDATALLNVIQSNGSDFTIATAVTPTETQAAVQVTLPAQKNANSQYWALYRFGDYPDGFGRLVCIEPWATTSIAVMGDTDKGVAPALAAPANPFIALASGVLTDNTPSSWLLNADTYIDGRQPPPAGIVEIVSWASRLWLIAGSSQLWGSWLLTDDDNAGLYFSTSVSETDPNAGIEGFLSPIGTQDNDVALRLLPLEDRMLILMRRKPPFVLTGDGPASWAISDYPLGPTGSMGLVARNAASLTGSSLNVKSPYISPAASIVFLTVRGIEAYDTYREPRELSQNIRQLIAPQLAGLPAFAPGALAQAAIWQHGQQFYVAMPASPSDTYPTVIYRYEEGVNQYGAPGGGQENGIWGRWPGINVTGGCSIPNTDDNAGHYVGGRDGMLYLFVFGAGDKATSGGAETGIDFAFTSRAYGYDAPFAVKTPSWLDIDCEYQSGEPDMALTVGVAGRQQTSWSQSYTLQESSVYSAAGNNIDHISLRPGFGRGETLSVSLAGSGTRMFAFGPLRLTAAIGSERRR